MQSLSRPADLAAEADRLLGTGRLDDAIRLYETALVGNPSLPDAWFNLGWALRQRRRFEAASQAYDQSLRQGVRNPEHAHLNRAAILSDHLYAHRAAVDELEAALRIAPDFVPALLSLGALHEDLGEADLARAVYHRVLRVAHGNGRAAARLAMIDLAEGKTISALSGAVAALHQASGADDAAEILFAKAAALDADAQYDAAFDTLVEANNLARTMANHHYDPAAHEDLVTRLIETFPDASLQVVNRPAPLEPIFIVGMFRSGSTLTEQILARHPDITAGGELEYIPAIARTDLTPYPESVLQLDTESISAFRQNYLSEMARAAPSGKLTDKRCDNVQHLGLIDVLFPGTQIIHTVRDPLDTLISVLFLHFGDAVTYGHNQRDAAHYYVQYRRLLSHWRKIIGTRIHDVDYDRLVVDPRREIENALIFLGLPWDDACLPSATNHQSVRTASSWQIRKPLHRQSSGRWRHYARQLQPARQMLIDAGYM